MGIGFFDSGLKALDMAASLAAIIGLVIVVIQQIQSRLLLEAQTRPYIYISCRKMIRNGKSLVVLDIRNSGKSPASEVIITSIDGNEFHSLKGSSKLPFVNEQTTLNVFPGQRLSYLIGSADKNSQFPLAKGDELTVEVKYRGARRDKIYSEQFVLTLSTSSFLVESVF
jgi:hypothetical protein